MGLLEEINSTPSAKLVNINNLLLTRSNEVATNLERGREAHSDKGMLLVILDYLLIKRELTCLRDDLKQRLEAMFYQECKSASYTSSTGTSTRTPQIILPAIP